MSEDQLQAACYQWTWNTYPELRHFLFAVPNGGKRHAKEAMKFKATGLVPGIPDMLLVWPRFVAFELKTDDGRLSESQKVVHAKWVQVGIELHVTKSLEAYQAVINGVMRGYVPTGIR